MSNFRNTNQMIDKIIQDLTERPTRPVQVPGSVFAQMCLDEQELLQREIDADYEQMHADHLATEAWLDHVEDVEPDDLPN